MNKGELARKYFMEGYNCSQAVCKAFSDYVDIDEKTLLKLSSGFGGGVGRLRLTCGAFSSIILIIDLLYGYENNDTDKLKTELYRKIQEIAKSFKEENGSLICACLLNVGINDVTYIPEKRSEEFYKKRPCIKIIENAANILEEFIEKYGR